MARQVADDTRLGAHGRLLREISLKQRQARKRLVAVDRPITPPIDLLKTRKLAAELHLQAQEIAAEERKIAIVTEELDRTRPKGLWAWISGKTKRHDEVLRTSRVEHDKIASALKSARETHGLMERHAAARNAGWNRKITAIEEEREAERRLITVELEWLSDARLCLQENSDLTHASWRTLAKAVEKLRENRAASLPNDDQQQTIRRRFFQAPSYKPR